MRKQHILLATCAVVALLIAAPSFAQSGGAFEITRATIDGGGLTPKSSATFVVQGTIGQPDTGDVSGGDFMVSGGFWVPRGTVSLLFSDGFESGDTSRWNNTVSGSAREPVPPELD